MKKINFKGILFSVLVINSLCGYKKLEQKKDMDTVTLRINNQGDPSSLHPHRGVDLNCRVFQKSLFEGLTRLSSTGEVLLAGAQDVIISPSKLVYTFTLRPMNWTNGEPVTAEHFASTWKAAISSDSNCPRSDLFYVIKNAQKAKKGELPLSDVGIQVKNQNTLVVELEHIAPYFLELVSNSIFSPIYDLDSETPKVFNGPYQIASWKHENLLILEKNKNYWDAESVQINRIEVSLVKDPQTSLSLYQKGELDWIGHPFSFLPLDAIPTLQKSEEYFTRPLLATYWMSCNTESPPLNNPKIRKALSMTIDRKMVVSEVLFNEKPTTHLISSNSEIDSNRDLGKAKELFSEGLKELNIKKEELPSIVLSYSDVAGQKKWAETLQQQWEKTLGLKVKLQNSDWNTFFSNLLNRKYQIGGNIWYSLFSDPIYLLDFFKYKQSTYNPSQWENKEFQKLLDLADHEINEEERRNYLQKAEEILIEHMPVIPIYSVNAKYLKSPKLHMEVNQLGQVDLKWAYFEE